MANSMNFVLSIFLLAQMVAATDLAEELRITYNQKLAIDKLRNRVMPYVTEDYMKEDLQLLRWLRTTNFNVQKAEERIRDDIKWRKQNKLATIHQEDFSDIEEEYPYLFTMDKQGEPVFIGYAGDWDIRGAVVTGRVPRIIRYMIQKAEDGVRRVRQLQYNGLNITRMNLVVDLAGFNIHQHTCPQCLLRILDFLLIVDNHYPGVADRVIFVNTPPTVAVALELIRNNANPETWKSIKLYGMDRLAWQKALLEFIDPEMLPEKLGGTLHVDRMKSN